MMTYHLSNKCYFCVVFIVINLNIGSCQVVPQIPCPQYFNYQYNGNEIIGFININGPPIGQSLLLSVVLSVGTPLTSKYPGSLELHGTQEDAFQRLYHNKPLQYKVKFPPGIPIPTLTEISYNNDIICSGSPVQADLVTTIRLHHNLATKLILTNGNDRNQSILPNTIFGSTYNQPPTNQAPSVLPIPSTIIPMKEIPVRLSESSPETNIPVNQEPIQCGVPSTRFQSTPLIVNGADIERGSWPWLAAVYQAELGSMKFVCGGNLLSPKAVITAAHCFIKHAGQRIQVTNYLIELGRFDISNWEEKEYVKEKCSEIHVHEDYKSGPSYDGDIAIAVLAKPVRYTEYIRPICLWSGDIDQKSIVGKKGIIVGWGKDENNKVSPKPKRVEQPVVTETMCLRSGEEFLHLTSSRTLCAGDLSGSGPCSGDSGSGLAMFEQSRWMLRGTVSVALAKSGVCDLSRYVVYSDVAQFLPWIQKYL